MFLAPFGRAVAGQVPAGCNAQSEGEPSARLTDRRALGGFPWRPGKEQGAFTDSRVQLLAAPSLPHIRRGRVRVRVRVMVKIRVGVRQVRA